MNDYYKQVLIAGHLRSVDSRFITEIHQPVSPMGLDSTFSLSRPRPTKRLKQQVTLNNASE